MKYSLRLLSLVAAGVVAAGGAREARAESGRHSNALAGSSYVFPSVANTQGLLNAFFKTKVTLYNPNLFDIVVQVQLTTTGRCPAHAEPPARRGIVPALGQLPSGRLQLHRRRRPRLHRRLVERLHRGRRGLCRWPERPLHHTRHGASPGRRHSPVLDCPRRDLRGGGHPEQCRQPRELRLPEPRARRLVGAGPLLRVHERRAHDHVAPR